MEDRFAVTPRGRIHYLEGGQGAPLILLHSNGGSAYDYETVADRLMRRFRVIAWDMPGQGDSDPIAGHMSVDDYADALVDFMDAIGLSKAHVLGSSIGGAICVALGARHASRVEKLFVVECPFRSAAEWQSMWWRTETNFAQPVQALAAVAPRLNTVTPEFLTRWNVDRNKAGAKTMMSVMWALRDYDFAGTLPKVMDGAIVVYGDKGPTIAGREAFVAALRAPAVEIMKDAGHFPMVDHPDLFCDIVERYAA